MRSAQRTWALALLLLGASTGVEFITPPRLEAKLHDPMRPSHAATRRTNVSVAEETLPPLHAILVSATSKVAIFGAKSVHEGERIGRYHIKHIHPDRVELFDGDSHLERRLFPVITTFEDAR